MINRIFQVIICFFITIPGYGSHNVDKCDSIWISSFEKFISYRDSVDFELNTYVSDKEHCLQDTAYGIQLLISNYFYGNKEKNDFSEYPSYLFFTTSPLNKGDSLWPHDHVSQRVGVPKLPVEIFTKFILYHLYIMNHLSLRVESD